MEASAEVATDVQDQLRLSAELWTLVVGTTFPVHELDPKYGTLVNPLVDLKGENPASGGYAEGGRIITTPHTGGNQLDGQQGGTSYTNPEHQLNPGNMYSEGAGENRSGAGSKFADQAKLQDHFARHGGDFGAKSADEYQAQANVFLTGAKVAGVLEKARPNGDIVRFNPATDEFGVVSSSGAIRTYYKPDPAVHGKGSNLDYFNAQ